jgi:kinesin family protein 3/17
MPHIIKIDENHLRVGGRTSKYDHVFSGDALQEEVFFKVAKPVVLGVLEGYNGTIFAYGQTGCGKTYTMMGTNAEEGKGIIPRTFTQIMTITMSESSCKTYLRKCSFIEIYNEEIHDLLSKDIKEKMDLREDPNRGVFVDKLTYVEVKTIAAMMREMEIGFSNRAVRETNMNA